ncbi:hypothetical protein MKW98_026619 [Papaver atlanticum]|uniref:Uncharacterized protein n=1 Tax=Papaver atlanticum TaxID=357466 RepID=A0AAD4RZN9_9MAGN|nr:hypothetical protein MKW98_026619 [Papaver atlanticum]
MITIIITPSNTQVKQRKEKSKEGELDPQCGWSLVWFFLTIYILKNSRDYHISRHILRAKIVSNTILGFPLFRIPSISRIHCSAFSVQLPQF